jgi:hypothetical protein
VAALEEALALVDSDPTAVAGKGDPYVVRLGVERQVERQIDEENYLHRVSHCARRKLLPANTHRPTSILRTLAVNLSRLLLAKFKKPTMLLLAF